MSFTRARCEFTSGEDESGPFLETTIDASVLDTFQHSWDSSRMDQIDAVFLLESDPTRQCIMRRCPARRLVACTWPACGMYACYLHCKASRLLGTPVGADYLLDWVCQLHRDVLDERDLRHARIHFEAAFPALLVARLRDTAILAEEDWVSSDVTYDSDVAAQGSQFPPGSSFDNLTAMPLFHVGAPHRRST